MQPSFPVCLCSVLLIMVYAVCTHITVDNILSLLQISSSLLPTISITWIQLSTDYHSKHAYHITASTIHSCSPASKEFLCEFCCTAGQYSYFPGCAPKLTRYFPGSKPYEFSQYILHISRYRVYMAVARLQIG